MTRSRVSLLARGLSERACARPRLHCRVQSAAFHCSARPANAPDAASDTALKERFEELTDLADEGLGGRPLFATDEWFATADNLIKKSPPVFDPDAFCLQGKVMDGWETRRRRKPGHDWCILKLGLPGVLHGIEIDTAHFTGNQVPACRVFGVEIPEDEDGDDIWLKNAQRDTLGEQGTCSTDEQIALAEEACASVGPWIELVPLSRLRPGYDGDTGESIHRFAVPQHLTSRRITHLRLNQHPDGGIARLRAWGIASVNFATTLDPARVGSIDLLSTLHGARALGCSNRHYGEPRNLLRPGRGENMGAGWETARNPNRPPVLERDEATGFVNMPGVCDWCVLRLGAVAESIQELHIDTNHFRGNYPESVVVEACNAPHLKADNLDGAEWKELLPRTRVGPSADHIFKSGVDFDGTKIGEVTHLRVSIYPDGGIMRVRAIGNAARPFPDGNC